MSDERKISICIPTWNRPELTINSFMDVYGDERVSEIVIVDDASELHNYEKLKQITDYLPKVKLFRNESNKDCYVNKKIAVELATNHYVVLFDSDNTLNKNYLDRIFSLSFEDASHTIFTPSFAKPHFNFEAYSGEVINKRNVSEFIDKPMFEVCLNACNYFVNREEYLKVWDGSVDPVTSDSIYFMSKWFESGNSLYIVPDLNYEHKVHNGHYEQNVARTPKGFHQSILKRLREMK